MNPTREVYWNISGVWIMYLLLIPILFIFVYGIYSHYRLWRLGMPDQRFDRFGQRIQGMVIYVFGQVRLLKNLYGGISHALFFSGLIILFIGTLVVMVQEYFHVRTLQGNFYLYFQSLALDVFGFLAIVGVLIAIYHRYVVRPDRLNSTWRDALALVLLLSILITGFMVEALRIIATDDFWSAWSPVGASVGRLFETLFSRDAMPPLHAYLWWLHILMVFAFIAWIPYSKLLHILTSTANIYLRSLEPKGAMLRPLDIETAETFGVKEINQMTWKDLLDLDACTECGRCQDACPAFAVGKPLSPKSLILDLREYLHALGPELVGQKREENGEASHLTGEAIKGDTLWSCTTCMACMQECPTFIEHVPKIVDMRRYLVMEEAQFPETMQESLRCLESRGHPYPGTSVSRIDWCGVMNIKILSDTERSEYLYWVGCSTALDSRKQKVARSFSRLLQQAGVDFAILGEKEYCSGDPARRIGNEYLFEMLARQNIEMIQSHKVEKIVTTCPHCFNTLKNEYPRFGASFEVYHHSQLLADLIKQGRLKPSGGIEGKITYHDPCYLGRYNDTYTEPREVIAALPEVQFIEMQQRRDRSFCCGAGGGQMWMEDQSDQRVNNKRADHVLQTGSDIVAVACPFCMTMLEDGITSKGEAEVKVLDIAELMDDSGPRQAESA